jgi:hypothetical protein
MQYKVTWVIELDADSPEEAAWEALRIQRDKSSEALSFDVEHLGSGKEVGVDLLEKIDPRILKIQDIIRQHGNFSTYDVEADHSPCVAGAGFVISLAESFYEDKVTVFNYNDGREESEYDTTYDKLPDGAIDTILELAEQWAEVNLEV